MSDDLRRLIVDLDQAAVRAGVNARKAVQVEAHRMKADWRERVTGVRGMPDLPRHVTYDTKTTAAGAEAEVGYEQRGQGELGNIAEFGSSTQGPKRPAGAKVLSDGAERLARYLEGLGPL